jgi:hypothetical protein
MPEPAMSVWTLDWEFGSAEVIATAGILRDCTFRLPSGRRFSPLARAPWAGRDDIDGSLPGHMRHLGGEFLCLPFGSGGAPQALSPRWDAERAAHQNDLLHGPCADREWRLTASTPSQLDLRIDYPEDHDIRYITRRIRVDPTRPAIDVQAIVHARRKTRLPLGIHPILRLPDRPQSARLAIDFEYGLTYPGVLPPAVSPCAVDANFARLSAVPMRAGGCTDFSHLPLDSPAEELFQLCGVAGEATLHYLDEQAKVRLNWDRSQLPSCLVWISDRALKEPPWGGRFRGIGIEPAAAAFDLSIAVAAGANPIAASGVATALAFEPATPVAIEYRIAGEDCAT